MTGHPSKPEHWRTSKALATAILHDRAERRKLMSRLLLVVLAILALGNWALGDWLAASIWRFLIWWGACAVLTVLLLLLACFDALAVVREERDRLKKQLTDERDDHPGR